MKKIKRLKAHGQKRLRKRQIRTQSQTTHFLLLLIVPGLLVSTIVRLIELKKGFGNSTLQRKQSEKLPKPIRITAKPLKRTILISL